MHDSPTVLAKHEQKLESFAQLSIIIKLAQMNAISDMFRAASKSQNIGIEGYHVDNKYFDARRSKEQRTLEHSRERSITMNAKSAKKTTFIDEILKKQSNLPGPSTYDPKVIAHKESSQLKVASPSRKTIFDQMQIIQKKRNYPAAGKYDKIQINPDKSKLKSNLSKADNITYLDSEMRASIQCPGVGQYNSKGEQFDQRGPKWKQTKEKKSQSHKTMALPPVGTYNPLPIQYQLFDNLAGSGKKSKKKTHFNREERFKSDKSKPLPFYNIGSEWGMQNKLKKKDILSRVGSSLTHHSVYY